MPMTDAETTETYSHEPERHVRITLDGGGSYVVPLDEFSVVIMNEMDGADIGSEWTIELIEMSPAEYAKLPDFTGH